MGLITLLVSAGFRWLMSCLMALSARYLREWFYYQIMARVFITLAPDYIPEFLNCDIDVLLCYRGGDNPFVGLRC
jgi:hypothetical protein